MKFFEILKNDKKTFARTGIIKTNNGTFKTPVFMPVGTKATVKAIMAQHLYDMGCEIILGNLYHLYLQPGIEIIKKAGGLHRFMNWKGSILTDSGGFQVYSLDKIRTIAEDGVEFKSVIDGSTHFFTPGSAIQMQAGIGSDIMMVLDECISFDSGHKQARDAAERTLRWADLSIREKIKLNKISEIHKGSKLFGIIQGGFIKDIRRFCAEVISGMDFDGIAIGGLSVGEDREMTFDILEHTMNFVDRKRPIYFMGLGDPIGIIEAINIGVDMFDCVLPTRISRMGSAYTLNGKINIKNKKYSTDFNPIMEGCGCYACKNHSSAYIRHLYKSKEILAGMLLTIHNLNFIFSLIENARVSINEGKFDIFRKDFITRYNKGEK